MRKYLIALKGLSFSDERGNFIVREEYESMSFSNMLWTEKFMSSRKEYFQGLYDMTLIMSPIHNETLREDQILRVFELVEEYLGMEKDSIFERTQKWPIVHARWYAMKICADRDLTEQMIADAIGMNPATVNNGKVGCRRLFLKSEAKRSQFELATDYVLSSLNGRYVEDGSGQKLKS